MSLYDVTMETNVHVELCFDKINEVMMLPVVAFFVLSLVEYNQYISDSVMSQQ